MYNIYFGEKVLVILYENEALLMSDKANAARKEYKKNELEALLESFRLDDADMCYLYTEDQNEALEAIKSRFTVLLAGGGIVYTPSGEVLLIFRRGKWDLPKGKLDEGESIEACSVREVEEETGLVAPSLEKKVGVTYHTYEEKGKSILKESHWYTMKVEKIQDLQPQFEEDIEICEWVPAENIANYTTNMQPSVRDILAEALRVIHF